MKRFAHILLTAVVLALAGAGDAYAQKYPERKVIRQGNRSYERGEFEQSETDYRRALEIDSTSYTARYNLGNAIYKLGRYPEAQEIFAAAAADTLHRDNAAAAHYNTGNAMFQQRHLEQALEEYKKSLRINPDDMEAKFNLAYVKKLLEKDDPENNGGGGDDNQDQNQDQNQNQDQQNQDQNQDNKDNDDQNKDQNKDNKDDKQDGDNKEDPNKDPNKDKDGQDNNDPNNDGKNDQDNKDNKNNGDNGNDKNDDGKSGQQPQPTGIDRQQAEQLLQAIQQSDEKTKEKVDAREAQASKVPTRRNW